MRCLFCEYRLVEGDLYLIPKRSKNMIDRLIELALENGLSLETYAAGWEAKRTAPLQGMDKDQRKNVFYSRYNWERYQRAAASYVVSPELARAIAAIDEPQRWMLVTEDWCVDSAFAFPVIAHAVRMNPLITLRVVLRDAHPEVMDRYLTNGARSIPRLVAFDSSGNECFNWGPAPAELRAARASWVADGVPGPEISQRKIDWYEDRGWERVDTELAERILARICTPAVV